MVRHDAAIALGSGAVFTADRHGLLGEPAEKLCAVGHLAGGIRQCASELLGLQQRQVFGVVRDELEDLVENLAALHGGGLRPFLLRICGDVHRATGIVFRGALDVHELCAGGGIHHAERVLIACRDEFSAEEETGRYRDLAIRCGNGGGELLISHMPHSATDFPTCAELFH